MAAVLILVLLVITTLPISGTFIDDFLDDVVLADKLPLVLVSDAADEGAVCLDGSAPGYYFRPGSGSGNASWIIFFEVSSALPPGALLCCLLHSR
eukprot:jgi/Mesen1/9767/ME000007S09829